jgi:hypothetical protein
VQGRGKDGSHAEEDHLEDAGDEAGGGVIGNGVNGVGAFADGGDLQSGWDEGEALKGEKRWNVRRLFRGLALVRAERERKMQTEAARKTTYNRI